MSQELFGNLHALSSTIKKQLLKLYDRKVDPAEPVSAQLARELYALAKSIDRRLGVLLDRRGNVEAVCVGTKTILYLPELGRLRASGTRLRQVRLVFSDLSRHEEPRIPGDVLTDLQKLRLDAVISVKGEKRMQAAMSYLGVDGEKLISRTVSIPDIAAYNENFEQLLESIESELEALPMPGAKGKSNTAMLVGVYPKGARYAEDRMAELRELATTAGLDIKGTVIQYRAPDPTTYMGMGKVEEVVLQALALDVELLVFDTELKPSQWRSITNTTELKVIDRSMLILDIFASRASSSEGRLQVELAQLKYNLPKLVEKDAGLSRLSGGIGGRGPGETKLEIGRRRFRDRITELEHRIAGIVVQRDQRRANNSGPRTPVVALIGYTNVGKSSLFNALTSSEVLVENKLFATLDTTRRRLAFGYNDGVEDIILSDTVGFIRELPDELKAAFKATLEELYDADLLIHVVDGADPYATKRHASVSEILKQMDIGDTEVITLINKIDLAEDSQLQGLIREFNSTHCVSAVKGTGIKELKKFIRSKFYADPSSEELSVHEEHQ
jgi:GTP-binding protein HflX